ncbi:MAG TPA: hypothetical protein VMW17_10520 [Candidatus Binatia bacterium]|nr:hypothetical protein [Candidatus Binatia bacterium]
MRSTLRIVAILLGVGFTLQGGAWLVVPERAAAGLGMPALDGLARSTQFGDFAAFFLTLGATTLTGLGLGRPRLLYVPAGMLAGAALCRSIAWAAHGAAFAAMFIAVEIAASLVLLATASTSSADRRVG